MKYINIANGPQQGILKEKREAPHEVSRIFFEKSKKYVDKHHFTCYFPFRCLSNHIDFSKNYMY